MHGSDGLRFRTLAAVTLSVSLAAIFAGGGSAYAGDVRGTPLPAHLFTPYFQAYTDASPAAQSRASGAKYLTMAFLQTAQTGSCEILWNGDPTKPVARSTFGADIAKIRARGGDVIPSFGGFSADDTATEIADSCSSVDKIAAAYEKVVTTYDVTRLDMDVEDNSLTNLAGIDRRNKAIHQVEQWARRTRAHRPVRLHDPDRPGRARANRHRRPGQRGRQRRPRRHRQHHDVRLLRRSGARNGRRHEDRRREPGRHAALAVSASFDRTQLWRMVGITEMIGIDDYGSGGETGPLEIFSLADAQNITRVGDEQEHRRVVVLGTWPRQRGLPRRRPAATTARASRRRSGNSPTSWPDSPIAGGTYQREIAAPGRVRLDRRLPDTGFGTASTCRPIRQRNNERRAQSENMSDSPCEIM